MFHVSIRGGCFSDGEGFIFKGGVPHGGTSVLVGGLSKKIIRWEVPLMPPPLWETLWCDVKKTTHVKKVGYTSEFPFGIYWWTLKHLKNQNFEKMKEKKNAGDIIIFHMCTKSHNNMKYSSWDTELDRTFFVILGHFLPFYCPPP